MTGRGWAREVGGRLYLDGRQWGYWEEGIERELRRAIF